MKIFIQEKSTKIHDQGKLNNWQLSRIISLLKFMPIVTLQTNNRFVDIAVIITS